MQKQIPNDTAFLENRCVIITGMVANGVTVWVQTNNFIEGEPR